MLVPSPPLTNHFTTNHLMKRNGTATFSALLSIFLAVLLLVPVTACTTDDEPDTVTKTVRVRVLPADCDAALAVTKTLLRRVDYYPHLVAGAAQSEGWPRQIMAESRTLTKDVRELRRGFADTQAECPWPCLV